MGHIEFLHLWVYGEFVLCVLALCFLIFRGRWRRYWALGMYLIVRASSDILLYLTRNLSHHGWDRHLAYDVYFYGYWIAFAIETVLVLFILYGSFRLVLTPLSGLRSFGSHLFRGLAILCMAVAVVSSFATQLRGVGKIVNVVSQLQRTQSVFTLCVVLILLSAARSVGLSYRSTVIGVTTGAGIMAAMDLVLSAGLARHSWVSWQYEILNVTAITVVLGLWAVYLALPDRGGRAVDPAANTLLARWNRTCLTWSEGT